MKSVQRVARFRRSNTSRGPVAWAVRGIEALEPRLLLTASVLSYHNDAASTGVNPNETQLTPSNVNVNQFSKNFSTTVDGQLYAQPLYDPAVNITTGANAGTHNVVFVATEHDSLYAIDADGGTVLWQDSLISTTLPGVTVLPGASAVTTVPATDTGSTDLSPEIGITGTPVIDPANGMLYVVANTKQIVGGKNHYVFTIYKINIQSGAIAGSDIFADTTYAGGGTFTYNSGVYSLGSGDGAITVSGQSRIYFNGLTQMNRPGLVVHNGSVYVAFASHGDNGPYHGWILGFSESSLASTAVFNSSPNGGENGIWQSGGIIALDPQGFFYVETGNGSFNMNASNFNTQGFPIDGNYGDCFLKLSLDPTTSQSNMNINGWGMKVVDYFAPFNDTSLSSADRDLGSGAPIVLPDSVGSAQHPHLLLGSGKEGKIYLIDRDNMGKFDAATDHVVEEQGSALSGSLDTPAYFNGQIYYVGGYTDRAKTFSIANASFSAAPTSQSVDLFGFPGSTPSISANGTTNGIVWDIDHSTNQLRAYSAASYATELWTSNMNATRDALGSVVKFSVPTVANGRVYVGTANALVVYGPPAGTSTAPAAPTKLTAVAVSGVQINLAWLDNSNNESAFQIDISTDGGKTFKALATVGVNVTSYTAQNLLVSTSYTFRVSATNSIDPSAYTNLATAVTNSQPPALDFSGGFANAKNQLTLTGSPVINGTGLELTDGKPNEAASVFSTNPVGAAKFSSQFTFQLTSPLGDGFTFAIQNVGPAAIGPNGGSLGYQGILKSAAIKFDLYNNSSEGVDSTGLFTNGAQPYTPSVNLTGSGIDLHSGDLFRDTVSYDGTTLTNIITDTKTGASATQTYTVNIPSLLGSNNAYVGFTAGTGGSSAVQTILTWTYTPTPTAAPSPASNLTLAAASGTQINLSWQSNSSNAAGFRVERSTDGVHFAQVFETGATVTTYLDVGLTPNQLYYYEIIATNGVGDAMRSNIASLTTPVPPATPTNVKATLDTPTEVDLSWTNNATNDTGYNVLRKASTASEFVVVGTLPANSTSYKDMAVAPGTNYDYHIQCVNVAGYSDFGGINLTTPLALPAPVVSVSNQTATLTWAAVAGATSYNIYRSTTSGGEGTTPFVTGITATTYVNSNLTPGTTYYYTVAAVNSLVQSPQSAQVTAVIASTATVVPPANLKATGGSGVVTLTWTAAAGAQSYDIYRGTKSAGEALVAYAANVTATTFVDKSVTQGTTYYYFLTTVGAAAQSHRSSEVFAAPTAVTGAIFRGVGSPIVFASDDADAKLLSSVPDFPASM